VVDLPERRRARSRHRYFCAAELLANVGKHSGARHATLEAVYAGGLLRLRVHDDAPAVPAWRPAWPGGLAERIGPWMAGCRSAARPEAHGGHVELPSHA